MKKILIFRSTALLIGVIALVVTLKQISPFMGALQAHLHALRQSSKAKQHNDSSLFAQARLLTPQTVELPDAAEACAFAPLIPPRIVAISHEKSPKYERVVLRLKGMLKKEMKPLAIVETPDGSTSIVGVGGTVGGQTVIAISNTSVTLRDAHGTYTLAVEQQ